MFNPKTEHFFICGITGSGKTTFATSIYEKLDTLCVFVNTNEERIPERKSQIIVWDVDEVIKAINLDARKICLNPKETREIASADIERLCNVLFHIGSQINKERREITVFSHLFIDEVQEYSSLHRPNANIDRIWKRGRRYGIVGVAISQRPADVSHTILTQCKYHVIFRLGQYEVPYFQRYRIPIEDHEEWLKRKYHFTIFDGADVSRFYPIKV